jgi:hypothetical protein
MAVEDREALEERLERYAEDLKREQGMN